ncbi:MAG TPA: DUF6178 family protein [Bacteriovoracaceae bacterium]|nr:DUF6178 family protein [Bacteriovoracaceae bacterium]
MNENVVRKDLLSQLLYEAQAYRQFEDIEKLVERGGDLSQIPIQPLYVSLQSTSKDQVASILPKLSEEQRQALRDIDEWKKDALDPQSFYYWMEVYSMCRDDEVVLEYVRSEDFLLGLKNQFDISTFDVEDPMYPDDDNYFLTEDNQLIVEYPEDFQMVGQLKEFIRRLYGELGVAEAYSFLFKLVVDSYQMMEEEVYQRKIERLRDFGFVDYYDALSYKSGFQSLSQVDDFIRSRKGVTGELDSVSLNQNLHASSLTPYQTGMDSLKTALAEVSSEKRQQFLHFNFIRLVNARMTLDDALKNGSLAMGKVGNQTRQCLELGFEYVRSKIDGAKQKSFFDVYDFEDLYKVGMSLIEITKKKIKKGLSGTPFEDDDFGYFLGMYWNAFLDNSHEEVTKFKFDGSSKPRELGDLETLRLWNDATETLVTALPFIHTFFQGLEKLKADGLLNDQFYLNYEVDNIDFEAIMISSFINFVGGYYQESTAGKMGVTISELRSFFHLFFTKGHQEYLIKGEEDPVLREKTNQFMKKFGLEVIPRFDKYLYQIMLEQLNGYEIDNMTEEDFRHIGGPILLNFTSN